MAKANSSALLALKTIFIILIVIGALFYWLWAYLPTQDPEAYFNFADQRNILGIANFWDVFSNVLFLHASLFGFFIFVKNYHRYDQALWECFLALNAMVFLTCWGSSYFHLQPSPERLFWDRLPMALGFSALVCFIFADRVTDRYHRILLPILSVLAAYSVWSISNGSHDLRFYLLVQFGSIIASLILLLLYRNGRVSHRAILLSFVFYALAKASEYFDHQIYQQLAWSGHTMKHVLAALSIFSLNIGASLAHLKMKR